LRTKSVRLLAGQLEGTRSNEQCAAFSNSEQSSSESAEINIPAQNEFKLIAHCGNNREHELMRQHEHSRAGIVQGWPTAQNSSNYDLKCTEQRKNWMYTRMRWLDMQMTLKVLQRCQCASQICILEIQIKEVSEKNTGLNDTAHFQLFATVNRKITVSYFFLLTGLKLCRTFTFVCGFQESAAGSRPFSGNIACNSDFLLH